MSHPRLTPHTVNTLVPGFTSAVSAIGQAAEAAGLERALIELVNLRASQINGCAYCVQYHISESLALGVAQSKLDLVVAWSEAGIFSEREEAALAWAEELTLIANKHVPDAAWAAVNRVFSEQEIAGLTAALCAINAWNRIAVTFRYAPGS